MTSDHVTCRRGNTVTSSGSRKSPLTLHFAFRPSVTEALPIANEVLRLPGQPFDVQRRTFSETHFNHDFSNVPVRSQSGAGENRSGGLTSRSCTLAAASPRACPFGGACHTCPVRVQRKLKIGQPDDGYEREADHVAEQVVNMTEDDVPHYTVGSRTRSDQMLQRGCARCQDDEDLLQKKQSTNQEGRIHELPEVPPIVHEVLRSPGEPLDAETRMFMEPRFGHDFSRVRVHTDARAAESVRAVNALAYTVGRDVVFGAGQYAPQTSSGRRLLAHELTHGLEQGVSGLTGMVQRQPSKPAAGGAPETGERNAPSSTLAGPSAAQKAHYLMFLVPMWRLQKDILADAERNFRYHLLAMECLRVAKGPGADPLKIAEFCRKWQIPLTLPVVGPTSLLRKIGKLVGGWPSQAAVFDPTGAINLGIKVIARMAPLLGRLQMQNALRVVFDEKVVGPADSAEVGSILMSCNTPQSLMNRLKESKSNLEKVWKETVALAEKIERIQLELGLHED